MSIEISPTGYGHIAIDLEQNIRSSAAELFIPESVDDWMRHPNRLLDGRAPVDLSTTKAGYQKVMAVLGGLKDGVFF